MRLLKDGFEFVKRIMCVNLRSGKIGMPQQILDCIEVSAFVQEMRRKCMAQYMGTSLGSLRK